MTVLPERAQNPIVSFAALAWAAGWLSFGVTFALTGQIILFGLLTALGVIGSLPSPNREGPIWVVIWGKFRFKWKKWRMGTAFRRELRSTDLVLRRGVSPLKGLFKVSVVLLEFKVNQMTYRVPALFNGRRHTIYVESGTNPASAMADPEERSIARATEAQVYADLADVLGEGNSFCIWSLHRKPDDAPRHRYIGERFEPDIKNRVTKLDSAKLDDSLASSEEITSRNWDRRQGLALTAENPKSWKPRKLDNLTQVEFTSSPAVKAALMAEDKLEGAGITGARVTSYPAFQKLLREVFVVKELDLMRERALNDKIETVAAALEGEDLTPEQLLMHDQAVLPDMQQELGNTFMIFDGTYHRVMWVTDYLSNGSFDALHTAQCNYFVSIYCDIWEASLDDSRRQDKGRLLEELTRLTKRNVTAQDEEGFKRLNQERYDALEFGRWVVYFRTLVIVSGESLQDLEENCGVLESHLARSNIRVQFRTVTGGDQIEWFFAALGSYGSGR